jgi:hypothetical protein
LAALEELSAFITVSLFAIGNVGAVNISIIRTRPTKEFYSNLEQYWQSN